MCSGLLPYLILFPMIIEFDSYKLIINIFCQLRSQVRANPSGALSSLVFMCNAIASWNVSHVTQRSLVDFDCSVFLDNIR